MTASGCRHPIKLVALTRDYDMAFLKDELKKATDR